MLVIAGLLQFFCSRFLLTLFLCYQGPLRSYSFNSSVVDSEPWAYLFLYKFFPTPFTDSRQRVYPLNRVTTR